MNQIEWVKIHVTMIFEAFFYSWGVLVSLLLGYEYK